MSAKKERRVRFSRGGTVRRTSVGDQVQLAKGESREAKKGRKDTSSCSRKSQSRKKGLIQAYSRIAKTARRGKKVSREKEQNSYKKVTSATESVLGKSSGSCSKKKGA